MDFIFPAVRLNKFDGRSLKNNIITSIEPIKRKFRISTGIVLEQNLTPEKISRLAAQIYRINSNSGLLEIKPDIISNNFISTGVFYYPWLKIIFSRDNKIEKHILINLFSKHWTDDLTTDFAKEAQLYV
jgi:hypothetical protein